MIAIFLGLHTVALFAKKARIFFRFRCSSRWIIRSAVQVSLTVGYIQIKHNYGYIRLFVFLVKLRHWTVSSKLYCFICLDDTATNIATDRVTVII